MTDEEYRAKSDEWKKGWRVCQQAEDLPAQRSKEFEEGYRYALEHPIGSVYVPMRRNKP